MEDPATISKPTTLFGRLNSRADVVNTEGNTFALFKTVVAIINNNTLFYRITARLCGRFLTRIKAEAGKSYILDTNDEKSYSSMKKTYILLYNQADLSFHSLFVD